MEPAKIDDILMPEDSEDLQVWLAAIDNSIKDGATTGSADSNKRKPVKINKPSWPEHHAEFFHLH
eukprot:10238057-Lingulodinium_polyedra.AAC.1